MPEAYISVHALSAPAAELQEQAILANLLMGTDKTVNTYAVRNDRALRKAKSLVCYKNGFTKQRISVKRLQADALTKNLSVNNVDLQRHFAKSDDGCSEMV